jgi:hypothetical protein
VLLRGGNFHPGQTIGEYGNRPEFVLDTLPASVGTDRVMPGQG